LFRRWPSANACLSHHGEENWDDGWSCVSHRWL